jgi:plastocyanin
MKTLKITFILIGIFFISFAKARVITITVQNISFSPATFTAVVGDTIQWVWVSGTHTTTSLTVPTGAATWSNPMNSSSTSFQYVITTPGSYTYWCAIHTTMMEGSFTVSPAGIPVISNSSKVVATLYPNPVSNVLNIKLAVNSPNNEFVITDLTGKEITRTTLLNMDNSIDVSTWKKGIYIYRLKYNSEDLEGKFEVQ